MPRRRILAALLAGATVFSLGASACVVEEDEEEDPTIVEEEEDDGDDVDVDITP